MDMVHSVSAQSHDLSDRVRHTDLFFFFFVVSEPLEFFLQR
jgi:hypothetical protein